MLFFFFFFNDTATTEIYTLSLHDALPILLHKTIQAFFQGVGSVDKNDKNKIIQAFSGSSDLPTLTKDVFNVTMAVNVFDSLWQNSFKGVPLMKGQLSWEIADVNTG